MSIADIEKVREAESKAEAIRKKAEDDVIQIIAAGRKEAADLVAKAEKDGADAFKKALDKAEEKAAKLYEEKLGDNKAVCDKIKNDGRLKLDEVIDDIVGKVVGTDGNS